MTITTHLLDTDWTLVKEITGLAERGWTDPLRGAGAGSLTIRNDHPDIAEFTRRRIVRCTLDGTPVFTWVLQEDVSQRLSQEGPGGKVTVWSGAGGLATLGMGKYHSAIVEGDGNSGVKTIGWIAESWDDSGWDEPTDRGFVGDGPEDSEWPDPEAQYLGSAKGGDPSYLRRFLDTDARPEIVNGNTVRLYLVGKGDWTAWWDGEEIATGDAWNVVSRDLEPLTAGGHQFAMEVESGSGAMTLVGIDDDGEITGVLYRSFTQGVYGTGSPEPWVGKEDGATPGQVTAGTVAKTLIDEAQTRGALDGISYSFSVDFDSDLETWVNTLPLVRYRDGEQLGDIMMQLTQQFSVFVRMAPDGELKIYESFGTDKSVTVQATEGSDVVDPADAAVAAAVTSGFADAGNAVRIGTSGGYGYDPSDSGIPVGRGLRIETFGGFGVAASVTEVVNASQELAADLREKVRQELTTSGPSGFRPYTDFTVGDSIGVREEDGGSYVTSKVEQVTVLDLPAEVQEFIVETERKV